MNNNLIKIFRDEIYSCIDYYNNKHNLNFDKNMIVIDMINSHGLFSSVYNNLSATNNEGKLIRIPLCILIDLPLSLELFNEELKDDYKSEEDFVKDCADHETTHLFDSLVNSETFKPNSHGIWFQQNYLPRRKLYTDRKFKITYTPYGESAYFSKKIENCINKIITFSNDTLPCLIKFKIESSVL